MDSQHLGNMSTVREIKLAKPPRGTLTTGESVTTNEPTTGEPVFKIRRSCHHDLRFVRDLSREFTDQIGFLPTPAIRDYHHTGEIFVATCTGEPVGFLILRRKLFGTNAISQVIQLATRRTSHGHGAARALIEQAVLDCTHRRISVLCLWCREDHPAKCFWPRVGFLPLGTRAAGRRRGGRQVIWTRQVGPITPADLILRRTRRNATITPL